MTGSSGDAEGVVKVITEFSEATYMASGIRSGVYQALLSRWGLSPMLMGGRFKAGILKSSGKGLLNQS